MAETFNFVEALMDRGLDLIVMKVFLQLNPVELLHAKLVSKKWHDFICRWVWNSKTGRRSCWNRLQWNWMHEQPIVRSFDCEGDVFDIQADEEIIVCGLYNGDVQVWDRKTLQQRFEFQHHGGASQVAFDKDIIVSVSEDSSIRTYDRRTGENTGTIDEEEDVEEGQGYSNHQELWGVRIYKRFVIVASQNSVITFFHINRHNRDLDFERLVHGHTQSVVHLECSNGFLLSGSTDKTIKCWDIEDDGRMISSMNVGHRVMSVAFRYPVAVSCSSEYNPTEASVQVWDVVKGTCTRRLPVGPCMDVNIDAQRLVAAVDRVNFNVIDIHLQSSSALIIWDLEDILNAEIQTKELKRREFETTHRRFYAVFFDALTLMNSSRSMVYLRSFWR